MTIVMRPTCWHQNFGPNGLSAPPQGLCLDVFSSITADFNISSAIRWVIQDQWSSGLNNRMLFCQLYITFIVHQRICWGIFSQLWFLFPPLKQLFRSDCTWGKIGVNNTIFSELGQLLLYELQKKDVVLIMLKVCEVCNYFGTEYRILKTFRYNRSINFGSASNH